MKLKKKYLTGKQYKSQKSTKSISGSRGQKPQYKAQKHAEVNGKKVLLVNKSGAPNFCAATGKELPVRGMAVEYNGKYYADFTASSSVS